MKISKRPDLARRLYEVLTDRPATTLELHGKLGLPLYQLGAVSEVLRSMSELPQNKVYRIQSIEKGCIRYRYWKGQPHEISRMGSAR